MRIGIDGQALSGVNGKRTGIGRYVFELCKELDKIMPEASFFVYSKLPIEMPVKSKRWISIVDPLPYSKYIWMWIKIRAGWFCKRDNLDVFWGPCSFLPNLSSGVRKVLTVHDLNHILVPETMSWRSLTAFKLFFKKDILESDIILTNSRGTMKRLYELTGVQAQNVVYPAISEEFSQQKPENVQQCLKKHKINNPYFLTVATWEPRKNLELLLQTVLAMREQGLMGNYKMLLVGSRGWKDSKIASLLNNQDTIVALGYISDEDLLCLYTGAKAFIFPSIYEGFGMPVTEAKACGTQVIATDIPEIREAGGENVLYIEPTMSGIQQGMLACMQTEHKIGNNEKYYTWKEGAEILAQALRGDINKV